MSEHTGAYSMSAEDTDPARLSEQNVQVTQALEISDCPFCGGEGHLNWRDGDRYFVECEDCEASAKLATEAEAIAAWNHRTRAEPDLVEVPPLIERLEFASANRVCAAPGANGRLCGKCYRCLMRQAAKALRAALTRANDSDKATPDGNHAD